MLVVVELRLVVPRVALEPAPAAERAVAVDLAALAAAVLLLRARRRAAVPSQSTCGDGAWRPWRRSKADQDDDEVQRPHDALAPSP